MFGQPQYYGYTPNYYAAPMPDNLAQLRGQQSPMQTAIPSQTAAATNGAGMIWVQSEQQALDYPVAPNSSVVLWNSNAPVIYLKQADATGRPTTEIYDLVKRTTTPVQTQEVQTEEYVTRKEFDALTARLDALTAKRTPKAKEAAENE